ncbi:MAG: XdhC family protein [Armatimonadetes bacterium]|nr:XdhC family protein [Armatimonadota bacterium]
MYEILASRLREGLPSVSVTVVSGENPLFPVGSKFLYDAFGQVLYPPPPGLPRQGGGEESSSASSPFWGEVFSDLVRDVGQSKRAGKMELSLPSGDVSIFAEALYPPETLYIFGGGHIGQALYELGKGVGFRVVVVDDRETFANRDLFPLAHELIVRDFETLEISLPRSAYCVIVTRGHQYDECCLEKCATQSPAYVGLVGSRVKISHIFRNLVEKGIPRDLLDEVHAPVGLDLGAVTPFEIALSIMAEILQIKNSRTARSLMELWRRH